MRCIAATLVAVGRTSCHGPHQQRLKLSVLTNPVRARARATARAVPTGVTGSVTGQCRWAGQAYRMIPAGQRACAGPGPRTAHRRREHRKVAVWRAGPRYWQTTHQSAGERLQAAVLAGDACGLVWHNHDAYLAPRRVTASLVYARLTSISFIIILHKRIATYCALRGMQPCPFDLRPMVPGVSRPSRQRIALCACILMIARQVSRRRRKMATSADVPGRADEPAAVGGGGRHCGQGALAP